MRILFLGLGSEQLGVSQLSAILKQNGYETDIAFSAQLFHDRFNLEFPSIAPFFDDTGNVYKHIQRTQPDVLAFGALTSTYQWGLQVARFAKEFNPNIKTVFGGVHPSAVPDLVIAKPEVDYVVVGEADVAFPQIVKQIKDKNYGTPIVNTRYKMSDGVVVRGMQGAFIQELEKLPFYDKRLWEDHIRLGDFYLTMATRGCPYRCTFCFNNFYANLPEEKSGKYVRIRSVDHVMEELKQAKKRYNIRWINFQDDVFGTSKKWLSEFAERYKREVNIPYTILTHPRYMDEEAADWLSSSGCQWVQMGVQSMDEGFKKDTLMRYEKSDHVSRALQVMHKFGLKAKVDHMFGLPDEPMQAQDTALQLYSTHHPKRIQTFWTCYLPGTDMMKEAIEKNRLTNEQMYKINEGLDFYFFRNTDNINNPQQVATYKAYEMIFRILPSLPVSLKTKIKTKHVSWVPSFIFRPVSMLSDMTLGLFFGSPEFVAYARHNLFHLANFLSQRIIGRKLKATKLKEGPN